MPNNQQLIDAVEKAADHYQALYIDWFNNFLTLARFAEYYNLSESQARIAISAGKKIHEQRVQS